MSEKERKGWSFFERNSEVSLNPFKQIELSNEISYGNHDHDTINNCNQSILII